MSYKIWANNSEPATWDSYSKEALDEFLDGFLSKELFSNQW